MTVTSNREFAKQVELMAKPAEQFKPTATYDPDGDCIEFLVKPDPFYAERVDGLVTVYISLETDEMIGSLIKEVSGFCRNILTKLPGFTIEIHAPPIRLQHIFLARLWSSDFPPDAPIILTYQKLIKLSEEALVKEELCLT